MDDSESIEHSECVALPLQYVVEAALVGNTNRKVFLQSTFILPSKLPEASLNHYRTAWNSSVGAYSITRRPPVSPRPFLMPSPPSTVMSTTETPRPHTSEEIRATVRPIQFHWADEAGDEVGDDDAVSRQTSHALSMSTIDTTSSVSDIASNPSSGSLPSTPITPFSRRGSPTFPSVEVVEVQHSRLIISLNLAASFNKVLNHQKVDNFEWLNLIQHDKEWKVFKETAKEPTSEDYWEAYKSLISVSPKKSTRPSLAIALDISIPAEQQAPYRSEEQHQRRSSPTLECLDVNGLHPHLELPSTKDEESVKEMEMAEVDMGVKVEEVTGVEEAMEMEENMEVKAAMAVKETPCVSGATSAFERMDLDAVFGGPADDLCEDYEARNRAARTGINTCAHPNIVGTFHTSEGEDVASNVDVVLPKKLSRIDEHSKPEFISPRTWRYIPEDDNYRIMEYMERLPTVAITKKRFELASQIFKWEHMYLATQYYKEKGSYKHEPLRQADRSRDWFWEPTNADNRRPYDPRILAATANSAAPSAVGVTFKPYKHHLNFMQEPGYHKNDTIPEISLWLVHSGHTKDYEPISLKGVLAAQAGKLIHPFVYNGPEKLLGMRGTKLRDAVTGYVDKVYHAQGTWMDEDYGMNEVRPKAIQDSGFTDVWSSVGRPQPPYFVTQDDKLADINDDGRIHCGYPTRDMDWVKPSPSKLSISQVALYDNGSELELHPLRPQSPAAPEVTDEADSALRPPQPQRPTHLGANDDSDLELLSAEPQHPITFEADNIPDVVQNIEDVTILQERSEEEIAAEDEDFFTETRIPESQVQTEAEEQFLPIPQSRNSDTQQALVVRFQAECATKPEVILTAKLVDALVERRPKEEITALQAQVNELHGSMRRNTFVYEYDADEDRTNYTNTWTRQNMPSSANDNNLAHWSESSSHMPRAQVHHQLPEEVFDEHQIDGSSCSPTIPGKTAHSSSQSTEDDADSEGLELEEFEDDSEGVPAGMRQRGELPPLSAGDTENIDKLQGVKGACEPEEEYSPLRPLLGTSSGRPSTLLKPQSNLPIVESPELDRDFFTAALTQVVNDSNLIAKVEHKYRDDGDLKTASEVTTPPEHQEGAKQLAPSKDCLRTKSPMPTIEEEEEKLDEAHFTATILQQQADTQAEALLHAYIEYAYPNPNDFSEEPKVADISAGSASNNDQVVEKECVLGNVGGDSQSEILSLAEQTNLIQVNLDDFIESDEDPEAGFVLDEDSEDTVDGLVEPITEGYDARTNANEVVDFDPKVLDIDTAKLSDEDLEAAYESVQNMLAGEARESKHVEEVVVVVEVLAKDLKSGIEGSCKGKVQLAEVKKQAGEMPGEWKQPVEEEKLAKDEAEDTKLVEQDDVDHTFDNLSCPSEILQATPTFSDYFFGGFAIAVGGKASKLAKRLSDVFRQSATVLHRS